MKKKEIESSLHAFSEPVLTSRGFEWNKAPGRAGKAWVRRDDQRGTTQIIVPVVTVYGPQSATVVFSFYLIIDSLQSIEEAWSRDPIFQELNPMGGTLPFTLSAAVLKDCPGGGVLGLTSPADLEGLGAQARRILVATVEWLERFSSLATLQTFLETASPEELGMSSILPYRRDSLLLQLYFHGGAIDKVRALATQVLDRPDDGNILLRAGRAHAAIALSKT